MVQKKVFFGILKYSRIGGLERLQQTIQHDNYKFENPKHGTTWY